MSVVIKGLKKPKECDSACPLCNEDDDCVLQKCETFNTWEEQYKGCPLIEVPADATVLFETVHGDTIERIEIAECAE